MLNGIGYWITSIADEKLPAPQELVGAMPIEQRERLAKYLSEGMRYETYLGYSWCRFGCGIGATRMGASDLTDTLWVWPEGLAHYVREHGVLLPEDFVQQALSRGTPVVPGWSCDESDAKPPEPMGTEYWERWASARRSPQLLEDLRAGSLAARRYSKAKREEEIAALERDQGLEAVNCCWRGCTRKALAGTYICAEHSSELKAKCDFHNHIRWREEFEAVLAKLSQAHGLTSNFAIDGPARENPAPKI